jgi:hypothetical protein
MSQYDQHLANDTNGIFHRVSVDLSPAGSHNSGGVVPCKEAEE